MRTLIHFGMVLAITAASAGAAVITVGYDASMLTDGAIATWAPNVNSTGQDFDWINGTATKASGGTNLANVNAWVTGPDFDLNNVGGESWHDKVGSGTEDVSWEILVRPGDWSGNHTLFNSGGNGRGTALVMTGSTIQHRFQDNPNVNESAIAAFDLSTLGGLATDFYHVVGVTDLQGGGSTPATATLYVNGVQRAVTTSTGNVGDTDGGDLAELGKGANIPLCGQTPTFNQAFTTGAIASFNYYQNQQVTPQRVASNYRNLTGVSLLPPVTSDLRVWLDANDIDGDGLAEGLAEDGLTGSQVNTWKDKTATLSIGDATAQDMTDANNTAASPALDTSGDVSGLPVVDFDGNKYLSRNDALGLSGNPALTVFIVVRDNDGNVSDQGLWQVGKDDGPGSGGKVIRGSIDASWRYNNGNHQFANDKLNSTSEAMIGVWRTDAGQTYGDTEFFKNSSTGATATTGGGTGTANIPNEGALVGAGYFTTGDLTAPGAFSNADIAELLIYNRALSDEELEDVGYYLQAKWGVNSTFVPEPATVGLLTLGGVLILVRRRRHSV